MLLFFSRRRRHTRGPRDWSSDVCSSDLNSLGTLIVEYAKRIVSNSRRFFNAGECADQVRVNRNRYVGDRKIFSGAQCKIGRASCREGGWTRGGGGSREQETGQ